MIQVPCHLVGKYRKGRSADLEADCLGLNPTRISQMVQSKLECELRRAGPESHAPLFSKPSYLHSPPRVTPASLWVAKAASPGAPSLWQCEIFYSWGPPNGSEGAHQSKAADSDSLSAQGYLENDENLCSVHTTVNRMRLTPVAITVIRILPQNLSHGNYIYPSLPPDCELLEGRGHASHMLPNSC